MLAKGLKTVNMSAISIVEISKENSKGTPAMYMTGVITSENKFDTNGSVQNAEMYNKYYDEVEADYAEFRSWVKEERDRLSKG